MEGLHDYWIDGMVIFLLLISHVMVNCWRVDFLLLPGATFVDQSNSTTRTAPLPAYTDIPGRVLTKMSIFHPWGRSGIIMRCHFSLSVHPPPWLTGSVRSPAVDGSSPPGSNGSLMSSDPYRLQPAARPVCRSTAHWLASRLLESVTSCFPWFARPLSSSPCLLRVHSNGVRLAASAVGSARAWPRPLDRKI
jgi:hypothetical protein